MVTSTVSTQFAEIHGRLLLAVMLEPQEIGRRIKAARESAGYTQLSFAIKAGISPSSVTRWESGKLPPVRELMRIAKLLDVDPADLVEVEVPPTDEERLERLEADVAEILRLLRENTG